MMVDRSQHIQTKRDELGSEESLKPMNYAYISKAGKDLWLYHGEKVIDKVLNFKDERQARKLLRAIAHNKGFKVVTQKKAIENWDK